MSADSHCRCSSSSIYTESHSTSVVNCCPYCSDLDSNIEYADLIIGIDRRAFGKEKILVNDDDFSDIIEIKKYEYNGNEYVWMDDDRHYTVDNEQFFDSTKYHITFIKVCSLPDYTKNGNGDSIHSYFYYTINLRRERNGKPESHVITVATMLRTETLRSPQKREIQNNCTDDHGGRIDCRTHSHHDKMVSRKIRRDANNSQAEANRTFRDYRERVENHKPDDPLDDYYYARAVYSAESIKLNLGTLQYDDIESFGEWPDCCDDEIYYQAHDGWRLVPDFGHVHPEEADIWLEMKEGIFLEPSEKGDTITFIGVGGLVIKHENERILIDPYFSRIPYILVPYEAHFYYNPLTKNELSHFLTLAGITSAEAILISHGHFDHAMDIGQIREALGNPPTYGGSSALMIAAGGMSEIQNQKDPSTSSAERHIYLFERNPHNLKTFFNEKNMFDLSGDIDLLPLCRRRDPEPDGYMDFRQNPQQEIVNKPDTPAALAYKTPCTGQELPLTIGGYDIHGYLGIHQNIPLTGSSEGRVESISRVQWPLTFRDMKEGELFNFLLRKNDRNILIFGSANFVSGQSTFIKQQLGENVDIDTLVIGVAGMHVLGAIFAGDDGGDHHNFSEFYEEVIEKTGATRILFHHWDDFSMPLNKEAKLHWVGGVDRILRRFRRKHKRELRKVKKENKERNDNREELLDITERTFHFLPFMKSVTL